MSTPAVIFWIGAAFVWVGVVAWVFGDGRPIADLGEMLMMTGGVVLVLWLLLVGSREVFARDADGRYAQSRLRDWFYALRAKGGARCCSDADGTAIPDVDWESSGGRYRVRIDGVWVDVPEEAVITEPNLFGRAMVWPVRNNGYDGSVSIYIRCFMPGPAS